MCDICTHRYRLRVRWCLHDRYHACVITMPRAFAKKKCVCARARTRVSSEGKIKNKKKFDLISHHGPTCTARDRHSCAMHDHTCIVHVHAYVRMPVACICRWCACMHDIYIQDLDIQYILTLLIVYVAIDLARARARDRLCIYMFAPRMRMHTELALYINCNCKCMRIRIIMHIELAPYINCNCKCMRIRIII